MILRKRRSGGFTLLEVIVAAAILIAGLVAITASFPLVLQTSRDAELLTIAGAYAQMKAEEIRRDDSPDRRLITTIQSAAGPTPAIEFVDEPRLAYSFSGETIMYRGVTDPTDPRTFSGVARVLIRYAKSYRPTEDVIYELRFN